MQRATTSHSKLQRTTTSHNEPQRTTASHNEPQRATTNHNKLQRATTNHSQSQPATTNHNHSQRVTTTHNEPQPSTTSHNHPQLRHKMNKTYKKLHSLVNALSPLNHLAAGILMNIVLILMLIQCLDIILLAVEAFGSVFMRLILRTWQLKGEKGNTNLLQNLFSVFIFSFSSR